MIHRAPHQLPRVGSRHINHQRPLDELPLIQRRLTTGATATAPICPGWIFAPPAPVAVRLSGGNIWNGTQRPNLTGDPKLDASERSIDRWFNTAAFAAAPQFTIGTSSRNPVRGPGYRNLDLAVARRVPLRGSRSLEVRAEIFNATNTPPFGAPNTQVGSAGFGTITSAGDPRVVQVGVKFSF